MTGGTGFVGGHTVAALVAAGHEARLLVRSPDRVARALGPLGIEAEAVQARVGDVTDAASVRDAVAGCDALVHGACVYSLDPRRAGEIQRVNARGTETVLRSGAEAGVDPIVHVSSYAALLPGDPGRLLDGGSPVGAAPTPYCASKAASEAVARVLQEEGAPVHISYPGMVWGPDDPHLGVSSRLALQLLAGRLPLLPRGTMPVGDVRDVAAVHAAQLAVPGGGRRDVASGENVPIVELVRTAVRLTGRRLPVAGMPAAAAGATGALGQVLGRGGIDLVPGREAVWIASQDGSADPSATVRELGVSFRRAIESVRDTIRWLHAAGHLPARRAGDLARTG